jgi:hypothetical protein
MSDYAERNLKALVLKPLDISFAGRLFAYLG